MIRPLLLAALLIHFVVTIYTLKDDGFWAPFPPFSELYVYQVFHDLVMALGIVFLFCFTALKRKGRSYKRLWLTMIATVFVGTFAPLIYLLVEKDLFE